MGVSLSQETVYLSYAYAIIYIFTYNKKSCRPNIAIIKKSYVCNCTATRPKRRTDMLNDWTGKQTIS